MLFVDSVYFAKARKLMSTGISGRLVLRRRELANKVLPKTIIGLRGRCIWSFQAFCLSSLAIYQSDGSLRRREEEIDNLLL